MGTRTKWIWENLGEQSAQGLATRLAQNLVSGDVIALRGNLGAGKTSFARALIRSFTGQANQEVPSPTFTLVQTYKGGRDADLKIWHFDLYRISNPDEALELDIEDAFQDHISLIEWPENLGDYLPHHCLILTINHGENDDVRSYNFNGGANWKTRLTALKNPKK